MSDAERTSRAVSMLVRAGVTVWTAAGIVLLGLALQSPVIREAVSRLGPGGAQRNSLVRKYEPDYEFATGSEIVLVFVGASFCVADRTPGFRQAVEDAKLLVERQARARASQFRAHAVSLDWKPEEAMAALSRYGAFDEVSLGSNWLNDGALRYVWRDFPSNPNIPQVLVVSRTIKTEPGVRVLEERVLRRLVGADEVLTWVKGGAAI